MRLATVSLAAAASLVLAILWYRDGSTPPAPSANVATLEATRGPVYTGSVASPARPSKPGDPLPAHVVVTTGRAGRAALRLGNGAELRLDVDTEVRLESPERVTLDRGAVFVDTGAAGGNERSVEIRTALGLARDVGTRFEVRLLPDAVRIRVRDGQVELRRQDGSHTADRGQELTAPAGGPVVRAAVETAGRAWDWVALAAAPFALEGKQLAAFLDWVSREGGWQVQFTSDALAQSASSIVIHGSIEGLTPEQALATILPTCGLTHRFAGGVLFIEPGAARGERP
jgi:ferric-dicitrate binding protein FerR (iron transport regulator)